MNDRKQVLKKILLYFFYSFLIWTIPFVARTQMQKSLASSKAKVSLIKTSKDSLKKDIQVNQIMGELKKGNKLKSFLLIFSNNIKVSIYNVAGGALLGISTIINIAINGFYTADVLTNIYYSGAPLSKILLATLPHSIELIGFWLFGAIGFMIAKMVFQYIKKQEFPSRLTCALLTQLFFLSTGIIFIAAWIETYISIH